MKNFAVFMLGLAFYLSAPAHSHSAIYLKGLQPVGIAGEAVACFVEVLETPLHNLKQVRALVAEPHGHDEMILMGPLNLSRQENGYYFRASNPSEWVQEAFLGQRQNQNVFDAVVRHGHHTDALSCAALTETQGEERELIEEAFDKASGDHDHDH